MLPPDRPRYQLVFINQVKSIVFTDHPVEPIKVAIHDTNTESIISPDCFLSSAKVKLIVLNALFWKNKGANWSRSDFNQSVLSKREGKPPILAGGSLTIRLQHGCGTFENIIFTDNSSWSNGEFRLGIILEGGGEERYLNGERVQEGVSEPIRVKDCRGIASQKPDRLELRHGVQCIKKIGKDRASLLQKKEINTVENFLSWYYNDKSELRKILCIKSESDRVWTSMVKHVMQFADEFRAKYYALNNCRQTRQVSLNNEANILNPDTNQFYFEYLINNNKKSISPLEEVLHRRTSHQDQFSISSEALVHMPERTVLPQTNGGPRLVGSGSSVPNPCENNLLIPDTSILNVGPIQHTIAGVFQVEVSSDSGLMDNLFATSESTTNNYFQSPSRSNSFDAGSCEALVQQFMASMSNGGYVGQLWPRRMAKIKIPLKLITFLVGPRNWARIEHPPTYQPQQSLVHLMGRNKSICINVGPHVVGSGSSGQIENDIIEGDVLYEQLPAICDISSMNLLNEHISTSSGEHIAETQHSLFHETNHVNVERGNILNGDSVQRTDDGGSPQLDLSSDYIPMEYPYATDAESTFSYFTQIPLRSEDFECFTGSMSNSVDVGPPLTPRKKRSMMAPHAESTPSYFTQIPSRSDDFECFSGSMSNSVDVGPPLTLRKKRRMMASDAESTPSYFTQIPSRSDDFECFTGSMSNSVDVGPPLTPRKKRRMMAPDAESTPSYFTQIPSRSDDFECFTGSMSNSADVGPPLTPRKKRRMMAFVRSVAFLAVPRKRARIVPPANQMTVPAI